MKPRYSIEIKHRTHERFCVWFTKHYGDSSGGVCGFDTVEECISFIKDHVIHRWGKHDSIVGRKPAPVTIQNTHFESVTDEITLPLLLGGQQSLCSFEVMQ